MMVCDNTYLRIHRHTEEHIQRNEQDTGKKAITDDFLQKNRNLRALKY